MISNVVVTNREDAPGLVAELSVDGNNVAWVTIANKRSSALARSSKRVLSLKFDDIPEFPVTKNQARKIKNFIVNLHVNNKKSFTLVVNCHAGISRSAAVGVFCRNNLGVPVQFGIETFPNAGVMRALKVQNVEPTLVLPYVYQ